MFEHGSKKGIEKVVASGQGQPEQKPTRSKQGQLGQGGDARSEDPQG